MGGLVDSLGGDVLTAIVLAALGALLLIVAIGAFVLWLRQPDERPAGPAPRNARLSVSEMAVVDGGRRLVLVRRDNIEHLLLIGGPSDVVVESNIVRQRAAAMPAGPRAGAGRSTPQPAPRPATAAAGTAPSVNGDRAARASDLAVQGGAGAATAAAGDVRPGQEPEAPEADATSRNRVPVASPAGPAAVPARDGAAREADPVLQERLRAASTALALRQAAIHPAQNGEATAEREPAGSSASGSPAVAGLAAGIAALTAAAGARARGTLAESGDSTGNDSESSRDDAATGAASPIQERGSAGEPRGAAKDAEPAAEEEPARAVFGLRDSAPIVSPSEGATDAAAGLDGAGPPAVRPVARKADDPSAEDIAAALHQRGPDAQVAVLDDAGDSKPAASDDGGIPRSAQGGFQVGQAAEDGEKPGPAPDGGEDFPRPVRADAADPAPPDTPDDPAAVPDAAVAATESASGRGEPDHLPAEPPSITAAKGEPACDDGSLQAAAPAPHVESAAATAPVGAAPAIAPQPPLEASPSAAPRAQAGPAPLSGLAPGRGTTLGDLAERLEEALIQQAATGASPHFAPGAALAEPMPSSPAPQSLDDIAVSAAQPHRLDMRPSEPSRPAADRDEAAIIDFAARRRPGSDSLEEEMARLLGELTRDTTSR